MIVDANIKGLSPANWSGRQATGARIPAQTRSAAGPGPCNSCKLGGIVGGDEGPVGGVAQVDCHGVKVVGVHGEEGQEEDGEVQGEVKGEVEQLREKRSSWMVWRWGDRLKRP